MSAPLVRLPVLADAEAPSRPRTRGDCVDGPRPCGFASCSHHAIHGVLLGEAGSALADDELAERIESLAQSCTLDVADRGDATLEDVGDLFGVTRERIRQIEAKALKRVRWPARDLRSDLSEDELPEASAPKPVPVAARRIDWMGDGESQSRDDRGDEITTEPETDTAPAAMGAEETAMATKTDTSKAAGWTAVPCRFPGCAQASAAYRDTLDPALRPLCTKHRTRAQSIRIKRKLASAKAVAVLLAGAGKRGGGRAPKPAPTVIPSREVPEAMRHEMFAEEAPENALLADLSDALAQISEHRAQARADEDRIRALTRQADDLRRDRDALALRLDRADERIAELEGQQLADAMARVPRPLARLAALAAVLVPGDDRISWTVGATGAGDERWCAAALGHDDAAVSSWEVVAAEPDEALAALVRHVEGLVRARVEALTAVLEGGR